MAVPLPVCRTAPGLNQVASEGGWKCVCPSLISTSAAARAWFVLFLNRGSEVREAHVLQHLLSSGTSEDAARLPEDFVYAMLKLAG